MATTRPLTSVLVANRGEIAIRLLRAAAGLGLRAVAVYSEDDENALHARRADQALKLAGSGPAAYLDAAALVRCAHEAGCDAIHPGYGFLSEDAAFAGKCREAGLCFVGPSSETLALLGDKTRARALAERCGVPVLAGTQGPCRLEEAREFLRSLGSGRGVIVKAVAGGGGRGLRVVRAVEDLESAFERCTSEAEKAFGNGSLYVEEWLPRARHIEVQILGDGRAVSHLGERECTLQRRHQKLVEMAPSPDLDASIREQLHAAALRIADAVHYETIGTVEFLVDATPDSERFAFIEVNARLQVEHTVTEEVTGVDLVETQLRLAEGRSLDELGLAGPDAALRRGLAIQVRINMESMRPDGAVSPERGTLTAFEVPSGPGLRTDSFGYVGYATSARFDSLLAKLIAYAPSGRLEDVLERCYRGLCEFRIEGVSTNRDFLQSLLRHPEVVANRTHTGWVEEHVAEIIGANQEHPKLYFSPGSDADAPALGAGAQVDSADPLAVLEYGKSSNPSVAAPVSGTSRPASSFREVIGPEGCIAVRAPIQGTIVSVDAAEGERTPAGRGLFVVEAMKMEHVVASDVAGVVRRIAVSAGDTVYEGAPLAFVEPSHVEVAQKSDDVAVDLEAVRADLAEVQQRHAFGLDDNRPEAVARRRKTRQRTARENVDDLCDADSFVEYGPLVIAAQRRRRSVQDLIERTPADGMLAGIGRVNGHLFDESSTQCVVLSYDYTVLAGTQGQQNHRKKDRMFELAEEWRLPLVFFTEGGGGRPGDTDGVGVAGLDCLAFNYFAKLSGLVPIVGINSGRCFAGNAALLGCCDVVIATQNSNIGMGGPAMIEGGGLGVFRPEEVGPMEVQVPNGVVDVAVADEAEAVQVAKRYLAYFQGALRDWECADQRLLRSSIPENRLRVYDVRGVIETLADTDSVLELRRAFGPGMVTALIRIEGRALGVVANNPTHLAGAIDSDGADKAARFMQLCDAFDLPLLFLCDTPGIMVGPEIERTGLVRHAARMFVTGASLTVPFFTIVLRKGYGLGAQAMAGGSFKAPFFTVSWPTGEFGGMGLEGAVKLGFRKELLAVEDPEERKALFEKMVDRMVQHGKAVNMASHFEIDEVIDPMDSRNWIVAALRSVPPAQRRSGKKRPCIDTW